MKKQSSPEPMDKDNPEWTAVDFKQAMTFDQLPASLRKKLGGRGAQKAPTKDRITIRLSHDVVTKFRSTGNGWQGRVDAALKEWLKTNETPRRKAAVR